MSLPTKDLVAVWKETGIPVYAGQRLLALRTSTGNRTIYLYDHDGERPGWISGDVIDATDWVPDHDRVYVAIVRALMPGKDARFRVFLGDMPNTTVSDAHRLRRMSGYPGSLGSDAEELRSNFPDIYKLLTTMQPGSPAVNATGATISREQPTSKVTSMTTSTKTLMTRLATAGANNTDAMKNAAFLEAGVIANKQLAKLAAAKAPFMVKGYIDTPVGKLVIANLFKLIVSELRPDSAVLQRLSDASMEAAYLDVIRTMNLDELIDELLSDATIKRAMHGVEGA